MTLTARDAMDAAEAATVAAAEAAVQRATDEAALTAAASGL